MRFRILSSLLLILTLGGCAFFAPKPNLPSILTSAQQQWTIPRGIAFKAIQKPAYPNLTEFIVTDGDLAVVYKGNLAELEQQADNRVIKAARGARTQGAIWGSISSVLGLLGAIFAKNKVLKKKE